MVTGWGVRRSLLLISIRISGIVHAIAAWRVFKNVSNEVSARSWLTSIYPKLFALHEYLRFHERVMSLRRDIIKLVRTWEFHEYFDPFSGAGYGTDNFSWTAALFIDAAMEELEAQGFA